MGKYEELFAANLGMITYTKIYVFLYKNRALKLLKFTIKAL